MKNILIFPLLFCLEYTACDKSRQIGVKVTITLIHRRHFFSISLPLYSPSVLSFIPPHDAHHKSLEGCLSGGGQDSEFTHSINVTILMRVQYITAAAVCESLMNEQPEVVQCLYQLSQSEVYISVQKSNIAGILKHFYAYASFKCNIKYCCEWENIWHVVFFSCVFRNDLETISRHFSIMSFGSFDSFLSVLHAASLYNMQCWIPKWIQVHISLCLT